MNPLTGKSIAIAQSPLALPPLLSYRECGFYKLDKPVEYKVVIMSAWSLTALREGGYSTGIFLDIYSSSTKSWCRRPCYNFMDCPLLFHLSSLLGNSVYFVKKSNSGISRSPALMAYDVDQDELSAIETPPSMSQFLSRSPMINFVDGKLCLLSGKGKRKSLWIRQSARANGFGWMKYEIFGVHSWSNPISFLKPNLVLMLSDDGKLCTHNVDNKEEESSTQSSESIPSERFSYVAMYIGSIVNPSCI